MCTTTAARADTDAPKPEEAAERARFVKILREHGYPLTAQRAAVMDVICRVSGHICAEHLQATVRSRYPSLRLNKTTVYRALDLFLSLGLVTEMKCGDGRAQYELASRGRHSHLICLRCGQLQDLHEDIAAMVISCIDRRLGFVPELEAYPVFGLCAHCRTQ